MGCVPERYMADNVEADTYTGTGVCACTSSIQRKQLLGSLGSNLPRLAPRYARVNSWHTESTISRRENRFCAAVRLCVPTYSGLGRTWGIWHLLRYFSV